MGRVDQVISVDFTREGLAHVDEIIRALNRLRYDVNGEECMKLALHLAWFGNLRNDIQVKLRDAEEAHEDDIQAGLALLKAHRNAPAQTAAQQPPASPDTKSEEPAAPASDEQTATGLRRKVKPRA